jgi:alpha-glucosidase (family GH31 glycosyl hydrolase)
LNSSSLLPEIFIGDLRIQILSDFLIRFEKADATGFEDQTTFHVLSRFFSFPAFEVKFQKTSVRVSTRSVSFEIPLYLKSLDELRFKTDKGWFRVKQPQPGPVDLPEPGLLPEIWVLSDYPRIIPPEMGATAPSEEYADDLLSGWQISDNSVDFYIFFPKASGYERFRRELTSLTGQIPLLPKHALGFIYSRYHPFRDSEIFDIVRKYKLRKMPIDMFIVDTDWRVGGNTGYEVNTELFPDIESFFSIMHEKNIRVMFNDHPEPYEPFPLAPQELQARENDLNALLDKGLDSWWYDRNWKVSLDEPAPGLGKDIWGMRLFYDITQKLKPLARVMILANVPGIKNGERAKPSNIATHRYPIWWTGDTEPDWSSLKLAVKNAVEEGIRSLLPYVSDDLGGHFGQPEPELFSRFLQFGCFAPIFRTHCTAGQNRDPWNYGDEVERVMGNYLGLRLKLLPYIYSAAKRATDEGLPILRRLDFEFPEFEEARDFSQYLFGDNLLVAPVFEPVKKYENFSLPHSIREIWIPPGYWHDAWNGKLYTGPARIFYRAAEWVTPVFVKNGSIIISQPESENSATQTWQKLVLDVFVPEKQQQAESILYEDDGYSNAYLEGKSSTTNLVLSRISDELSLKIHAPEGEFSQARQNRSWLIRFHFSHLSKMASIMLDDHLLMPDQYKFINKYDRVPAVPFICRPGFVGNESGDTVELMVENYSLDRGLQIKLKLTPLQSI